MKNNNEKSFSSISVRSFITVVSLLITVLFVAGALSYFIPTGSFEVDETGAIIPGTYQKGEVNGIAIWRVVTAPVRVFASEDALTIIMISVFLLIMSGVFNLLDKTDGIKVFIGRLMKKLAKRGGPVVCLSVLVFMLFGSFFGMFEELVTLVPLMVILMLSIGMDTMTGLGVCMLAACFGFSAAITNPFSVGLAASVAGVPALTGAWLRVIFFGIIYFALCCFLMMHLNKIERDPTLSLTYESDLEKKKNIGDFLVRSERYTEAIPYYRRALAVMDHPRWCDPIESIAQVYELMGDIPAAIAAWNEELTMFETEWEFTTGETADVVHRHIARLEEKLRK